LRLQKVQPNTIESDNATRTQRPADEYEPGDYAHPGAATATNCGDVPRA